MSAFCRVVISGVVSVAPVERFYGVQNSRRLLEFTVLVEQPGFGEGAEPRRSPFRVAVFDEALMDLCGSLELHQRVVVDADLVNEQWQGKDGRLRDSMRLSARNVVAGRAVGSRRQGGHSSSGCGTPQPPSSSRSLLPGEGMEDEDIPF